MTFPHLLNPLSVGRHTLRNRMIMGAMHTRLDTLDNPQARLAAFYRERAHGEAALMLTGGYAPNPEGRMEPSAPVFASADDIPFHRGIVEAVHAEGGKIVLQILHAGRYAGVPECVAPSALKAPINRHTPRALTLPDIRRTIDDFARTAELACQAGYDGVEIMGSEGYLLNEFSSPCTNQRDDDYGGTFDGRTRLALDIVRAVRERVGMGCLIVFRISTIDLVPGGMNGAEVAAYARRLQEAGVDILNTGIGWHEARVPTIASTVPRAAWKMAIANVKQAVSIPVIASNRINTPELAESLLAEGVADLISMARPFLADPDFARKVRQGNAPAINTCIACNQSCLDQIFSDSTASCLVNPRAGHELRYTSTPAESPRRLAVAGAGAAGMTFAIHAARRGHQVTLFERAATLGGQLNLARAIPGKAEFNEMLRWFRVQLEDAGVTVHTGHDATADELADGRFDAVVVATGITPRTPDIPGIEHPSVVSYADLLSGRRQAGRRVAIIGTGGIGFDVAQYLLYPAATAEDPASFLASWGVDTMLKNPGGLLPETAGSPPPREVTLLQRSTGKPGSRLGKTTGWVLKARLQQAKARFLTGVSYQRIDDEGVHILDADGAPQVVAADTIVVCAGQTESRDLYCRLQQKGMAVHAVGGSSLAAELDAARAIREAYELALEI